MIDVDEYIEKFKRSTSRLSKDKQIWVMQNWLILENANRNTLDIAQSMAVDGQDASILSFWEDIASDLNEGRKPDSIREYLNDTASEIIISAYDKGRVAEALTIAIEWTERGSSNLVLNVLQVNKAVLIYVGLVVALAIFYNGMFESHVKHVAVEEWFVLSRIGYAISDALASVWPVILGSLIVIVGALMYMMSHWVGEQRTAMSMSFSPFKAARYKMVADTLGALVVILKSNTSLIDAISITRNSLSEYANYYLVPIEESIQKGQNIYIAMSIDGFMDFQDRKIMKELLTEDPEKEISIFCTLIRKNKK